MKREIVFLKNYYQLSLALSSFFRIKEIPTTTKEINPF